MQQPIKGSMHMAGKQQRQLTSRMHTTTSSSSSRRRQSKRTTVALCLAHAAWLAQRLNLHCSPYAYMWRSSQLSAHLRTAT
jgi:hypothetical protein